MERNSFSLVGLVLNHPTWEEVRRMQKGGEKKTFRDICLVALGVCS